MLETHCDRQRGICLGALLTVLSFAAHDSTAGSEARLEQWIRDDGLVDASPRARYYPLTHRQVRFEGPWYYNGKGQPFSGHENGVERVFGLRTDTPGAAVEFEFLGTGVTLLHKHGLIRSWNQELRADEETPWGFAAVSVDDQPATPEIIDANVNGGRTVLASHLPFGRHRVRVTLLDRPRPPAHLSALSVIGFETGWDAPPGIDKAAAQSLAYACAVPGRRAWLDRAAELAVQAKSAADFPPVVALYAAAHELDELLQPLHRLQASSPQRLAALDESDSPAMQAYRARLNEVKRRAGELSEAADSLAFDGHTRGRFESLLGELRACRDSLRTLLAEQVSGLPPVIYVARYPFTEVNATGNYHCECQPTTWGCAIRQYDPGRPGAPKTIFSDPEGSIFDMSLALDARTIFFTYRRKTADKYWQVWEIGVDGTGLRQLTSGPHYNFSPLELSDGGIGFVSSRTPGTHLVCQPGPSTHLHRMQRDGRGVRDLSSNTLADFAASLLPDGRILFSRWEYVDSDLSYRNALWTQNPDGTRLQLYYGNTLFDPAVLYHARAIPGRAAVVCVLTAHHRTPHGAIGVVSNAYGVEAPRGLGLQWITEDLPAIEDRGVFWSYADPHPVSSRQFLVAYGGNKRRFGVYLLDDLGNKSLVIEEPAMSCFEPIPLLARPRPPAFASPLTAVADGSAPQAVAAPRADQTGTFIVGDVYRGLGPAVRRGQVKSIRIMEQLPKTVNTDPARAYGQSPLVSVGTYYAKRCWGEAPVEEDGSAHFTAPAGKEIYFQACDAEGLCIQTMTSATVLMPGEVQGCIGCHEPRNTSPPARPTAPLAAGRPPTPIAFPAGCNAGVIDYNQLVQPVFDRHCTRCHSGRNPAGGLDLCGDRTRYFNVSYDNLVIRSQSNQISTAWYLGDRSERPLVHFHDMFTGLIRPHEPLSTGSRLSRLLDYLDSGHCEHQVPLEDRRRVYLWIDALVPYYPTTDNSRPESVGCQDAWARPGGREPADWFVTGFLPVYNRRCAGCHGGLNGGPAEKEWTGKLAWINLTRPELSSALTAHLAQAAGGRGITEKEFGRVLRSKWNRRVSNLEGRWLSAQEHYSVMARALAAGEKVPVFSTTADPDLVAMRSAIEEGRKLLLANPRADMEGFQPKSR